jgi:hypothetical protein
MAIPEPCYLGDGVYASYDGFHIWLAVNDHHNLVVALDPEVFQALLKFSDEIEKASQEFVAPQNTSDVTKVETDATNK